ncbi:MAG TPA: MerR family transcriptional regulator [Candidatus Limnocylindria bacterium]|nr:MerR family transcriptional regulator [Candidatus Limnocylindria bacterium]
MTAPAATRIRQASSIGEAPVRHRIGAVAGLLGMSPSALRLWERQGLIRPERTASGYRVYTEADLARLRYIRGMRRMHLNAPGIRRLLPPMTSVGMPGKRPSPDGERLRTIRRELGLSLRTAAARAGVSTSFLSAIERNAAGASVATLQRLTRAYGITMLAFFGQPHTRSRRIRPAERRVLDLPASGTRIEHLAVANSLLEPQLFVLAARATSDGAYAHEGEEFMYVLDGALTIWLDERERYRLEAGDALTFPSTLPHRWRNRADGETRLLWINTPPTF